MAKDLGVNHETLRNWIRAADPAVAGGSADGGGLSVDERAELARLRKAERGVAGRAGDPASGGRLFRAGDEVKTCRWGFISTHANQFGVQRLCRVLGCSRSGY